jgi:hypothetical protein
MEKECVIKIGMNPHPWDSKDKPYFWVILVNDCNEVFGWSKTPGKLGRMRMNTIKKYCVKSMVC